LKINELFFGEGIFTDRNGGGKMPDFNRYASMGRLKNEGRLGLMEFYYKNQRGNSEMKVGFERGDIATDSQIPFSMEALSLLPVMIIPLLIMVIPLPILIKVLSIMVIPLSMLIKLLPMLIKPLPHPINPLPYPIKVLSCTIN